MFFGTHGTSLPLEANSVTLDPATQGRLGLPCMRVTYKDHPDDLKNARVPDGAVRWRSRRQPARSRAGRSRCEPQTQSVHLLGTCRMGNDPKTSVIDRYHRAHDVPEPLHLRRQQPRHVRRAVSRPETICALAFRAGERIAEFAKRGEI